MTRSLLIAILLLAAALSSASADDILFNRDIRPLLSDRCYACHGPDEGQRQADLRLDDRASAIEMGAFVPGDAEASELLSRIFSDDDDTRMPPPDSNKSLTDAEKELLRQWIAGGAKYQGHWSFEPLVRPDAPTGPNGIDALVGDSLADAGLEFSEEADRRALIRRLSYDLVGLPPTPERVQEFLDDTSPDAYAALVEELLASPHYGERMAIGWLDVVRFADTIGYHSDTPRNVWPYRDYVIAAFNDNKPFDEFTIEQLAGDLLPDGTQEQRVASCFNRLLLTTEEGGAQAKDYEARMLTDRVRAVGTVWLGMTTGCCQCHDHKFDPLTMRDFYSLGAFFADIQETIIGKQGPGMLVPDQQQAAELARLQTAVDELQAEYSADTPEIASARTAWEQKVIESLSAADAWAHLRPTEVASEQNSQLSVEEDDSVFAGRNPDGGIDTYRLSFTLPDAGVTGLRLEVLADDRLPAKGPGRAGNGNFVISEITLTAADDQPIKFASAAARFAQGGFPPETVIDGKSVPNNGWAIAGETGNRHELILALAQPTTSAQSVTMTIAQVHGDNHTLGRFRVSSTTVDPVPGSAAAVPEEIAGILKVSHDERNDAQRGKLAEHFKSTTPILKDLRDRLAAAQKARSDYEASLPRCLVSTSMANPRTVRFLPRGNWQDESGDVMQPALPAYFTNDADADANGRLNRLDLAHWIVSPDNPLTARVFVNRLWKQFFGIALSKNTDDIGSQGEWPTHLELLDWLASEFRESGWDVKHMVRTIVLSRTYRQSSLASPDLLTRDPENRLLARQGRFRLPAELVRDNALSVSGLLVDKIGGPSAKPYQPAGYWENLNFPRRTYQADQGENQYRRGLYTWWQRTFPHPSMIAFDAPSREECAADRSRSNIPQQALVLLNDPTYVEASKVLAAQILASDPESVGARIRWAYQHVLQRDPREDEVAVLTAVYQKHHDEFTADPEAAGALLGVGLATPPDGMNPAELAAWTSVARILLNLHETVTRS